jgi:hypothetical protein
MELNLYPTLLPGKRALTAHKLTHPKNTFASTKNYRNSSKSIFYLNKQREREREREGESLTNSLL